MGDFITHWHTQFLIDFWWRKKYGIPFGSARHREMSLIDMAIEYEEDREIRNMHREVSDVDGGEHLTKQEIDEDYDTLDLSQFDKKKNDGECDGKHTGK
jgi:predicted HAD superfamily phosphohydrolase